MDREEFGWLVRGVLAGSVFLVAFSAFQMGVGVSARAELPELGFLAHVYYSAGLFILGGMDLGTPVGGPAFARSLLWSAYFLAPVITTSAVVEGLRFLGNGAVERFGMRRHLIVAGFGKLGMNFVTASRRWDLRSLIVALDRDVNRAAVTQARRLSHVRFLPADIQLPGAFHHLALKRARAVVLLTDNDLLNLEVAFHLVQSHPELRVIAHCSDLALERLLADAWDVAARGRIHVFNSHRAAAQHLYEHHLRAHFAHTPDRDTVTLFLAHSSWFGEGTTNSRGKSVPPPNRELAQRLASSGPQR